MYIRIYFESFILVIFKKPMIFGGRCCSRLSWIGWPYAFGPQTLPSHLCHSVPPCMTVWRQNPRQFHSIFKWRLYMDSTWAKWKKHPPRRFVILCFFSCSFQPVLAGKQQASLRIAKGPLTSMCCFDLLYEVWILQKWRIGYGYACHCRLRLSIFFQHVGSEELKLQTLFKLQGCTWMPQEVGINGL